MISTRNEWDPLKSVVVGSAECANWPTEDPVFQQEAEKTTWKETPVPAGPVPDWIIEETEEDLAGLSDILTGLGVEVLRPDGFNFQAAGGNAEQRVRIFRLAWDFIGSDLGGRSELYERFYLSDSWRMTQLAYRTADTTFAESLVDQFMHD